MSTKASAALRGSAAPRLRGVVEEALSPADARRPLDLTLRLRPRTRGLTAALAQVLAARRAALTREELGARFGAAEADRVVVERWARRHRVTVVGCDLPRRVIDVRAPAARLARLFGVRLVRRRRGEARWLAHAGGVTVPRELAAIVRGVVGFNQHPLASRSATPMATAARPRTRLSFTAPEIARHYRFPSPADGAGQTVGVVALGGGYRAGDLETFFRRLRLPHPRFTDVSVHGVRNAPGGPAKAADGEVTGDIETVGALAPGAHVVVYFGPNSERGFLETVSRAVHDREHRPSVISISWGSNEVDWTRRTLRLFDEVLAEAAAMGITVCCSSGDHGRLASTRDWVPHVSFPGASAHVLACGGTSLRRRRDGSLDETAWHDAAGASGGGVSVVCRRPPWQTGAAFARRRGRGVPDVAANADPASGYRVFVLGRWVVGAGTSAAAPLWAGLVARMNEIHGRPLGLPTPRLYGGASELVRAGALRPIRRSQAGGERSRHAWNEHTGLGVPDGAKLSRALGAGRRTGRR